MRGLIAIIKITLNLAVLALAIIATLYVLDVVTDEAAREILEKVMKVLAIWTGASAITLIVTAMAKPTPPPSKPAQ
jgi:hypothetical protein